MGPRRRKPFRLRSRLVSVHQDLAGALYDLDIFTLFDSSYYTKQSSVPFLVLFFLILRSTSQKQTNSNTKTGYRRFEAPTAGAFVGGGLCAPRPAVQSGREPGQARGQWQRRVPARAERGAGPEPWQRQLAVKHAHQILTKKCKHEHSLFNALCTIPMHTHTYS